MFCADVANYICFFEVHFKATMKGRDNFSALSRVFYFVLLLFLSVYA